MPVTKDQILEALASVEDPEAGQDIVSLGYVSGLVVHEGNVGFALDLGADGDAPSKEPLREAAEEAARDVAGVVSATVVLTAEKPGGESAATSAPPESGQAQPGAQQGSGPARTESQRSQSLPGIENVTAIVAVASGKGGVGKSTVAVNLAYALAGQGYATGLLDADIYGPSIPRMVGADTQPESDGKTLTPVDAHGLKTMSIGYLVDEEKAMVWRGPMVVSAITQMLGDVNWGALDVLVVDMPPGTGDAQLTMAQRVPLAGAVIVSTPQDLALVDAKKGIAMFQKVEVPVLGIVENMSSFVCPHCGEASQIFGEGGVERSCEALGIDHLGHIPLDLTIRETCDAGTPLTVSHPDSPQAGAFFDLARQVGAALEGAQAESGPSIVVE